MAKIKYLLAKLKIGGEEAAGEVGAAISQLFRAYVLANRNVELPEIVAGVAESTKLDKGHILWVASAFLEEVANQLCNGNRVCFDQFALRLNLRGSFPFRDSEFDSSAHELMPNIIAGRSLRERLNALGAVNILEKLRCTVNSCMDYVTKTTNEIAAGHEIHIQGAYLGLNAANEDEGVWLENDEGAVVARATVISSDRQVVSCRFDTVPTAGEYALVVSCRDGESTERAPAVSRLKGVKVVR